MTWNSFDGIGRCANGTPGVGKFAFPVIDVTMNFENSIFCGMGILDSPNATCDVFIKISVVFCHCIIHSGLHNKETERFDLL